MIREPPRYLDGLLKFTFTACIVVAALIFVFSTLDVVFHVGFGYPWYVPLISVVFGLFCFFARRAVIAASPEPPKRP